MYRILATFILFAVAVPAIIAQDKPAYLLYNNNANAVSYAEMIEDLATADMVFFGEHHDNPIAHWLQLEVSKSLYEVKGDSLFLGAEMFESGNQLVIDEYLGGFYEHDKFTPEITQLWNNYKTDYRPLLDFAKDNNLRFIATNIPRRYASMIYKKGLESLEELSEEAKKLISPDIVGLFDPEVKAYAEMAEHMGGHVPDNMLNIQASQASKDATMAHFSLQNYNEGDLLLHFQGSYHSDNRQGIIWWIEQLNPDLNIKSITTTTMKEWEEMSEEEKNTVADYIIVVADTMTSTF